MRELQVEHCIQSGKRGVIHAEFHGVRKNRKKKKKKKE